MSAITPRQGGRYVRDAETGEVVRAVEPGRRKARAQPAADALDPGSRDAAMPHAVRDDGGGLGTALAKSNPSREKDPVPKASQARPRAGADAPPASEGHRKGETPVRRRK
jgi:hypothetical protein